MKTIFAYVNTSSHAGSSTRFEINQNDIVSIKCWVNSMGNPSYVFHMTDETTYYLVDTFDAMDGIGHLSRTQVKRKKDMFNRFA